MRWRIRAKAVDAALLESQKKTAESMIREARRLSSFRGYRIGVDPGYPYALNRKPGYPPLPGPPELINIQTGRFLAAWTYRVMKTPAGITVTVWNRMWYSKFMLGTSKMIPRPIAERICLAGRKAQKGNIEFAIRMAIARTGGEFKETPPSGGGGGGYSLSAMQVVREVFQSFMQGLRGKRG